MMSKTWLILLLASVFVVALASTANAQTCVDDNPVAAVSTIGRGKVKGKSEDAKPAKKNNPKMSHTIIGHIIDPASISHTEHQIPVCNGTTVQAFVDDSTGTPTNTSLGSLKCDTSQCSGIVLGSESYRSRSADGTDTDTITFLGQ